MKDLEAKLRDAKESKEKASGTHPLLHLWCINDELVMF